MKLLYLMILILEWDIRINVKLMLWMEELLDLLASIVERMKRIG